MNKDEEEDQTLVDINENWLNDSVTEDSDERDEHNIVKNYNEQ